MSHTILVVDDDRSNRVTLERLLKREGYAVSHAESGRQAMELLRAIARRVSFRTGEEYVTTFSHLLERLSMIICMGSAALVLANLEDRTTSGRKA